MAHRHPGAQRIAAAATGWTVDRPLRRTAGLRHRDARHGGCGIPGQLRRQLLELPARRLLLRLRRLHLRGRYRLLRGLVSEGPAGNRTRHLRRRQRGCGNHLDGRTMAPGRAHRRWHQPRGLAHAAADLFGGAGTHRARVPAGDEEQASRGRRAPNAGRTPAAAQAHPCLALWPVLLPDVRWFRRPRPVADPLLRQRLLRQCHDRWPVGLDLHTAVGCRPCVGRLAVRQVRCARGDVLGARWLPGRIGPAHRAAYGHPLSRRGGDGRLGRHGHCGERGSDRGGRAELQSHADGGRRTDPRRHADLAH